MQKVKSNKLEILRRLTTEQLKEIVDYVGSDGHTIFRSRVLEDAGWPDEAVQAVCNKYESDGTAKGTIIGNSGKPLDTVIGWYGLDVLQSIASALNVEYEWKDGRGFRAASINKALTAHFAQESHCEV